MTWVSWHNALARCNQAFRLDAEYYWGKGIKVCDRWSPKMSDGTKNPDAFINFLEDMGERPSRRHTLGRLDQDGHYEADNCEWQTVTEQNQGLNYMGDKARTVDNVTRTLAQWAEHLNLEYKSLLKRLERGWGDDAFRYRAGQRRPQHRRDGVVVVIAEKEKGTANGTQRRQAVAPTGLPPARAPGGLSRVAYAAAAM